MSESALSKVNTLLLLVVIALLVWHMPRKPQDRPKPQPTGRFQPYPGTHGFVLDTATGKLCSVPLPSLHVLTEKEQTDLGFIPDPTAKKIPLCSELE